MQAYWDTSALAKVYIAEAMSERARLLYAHGQVISSVLLPLELHSVARRRHAETRLAQAEYHRFRELIAQQRCGWTLLALNAAVLDRGEQIVGDWGVRSLDAIHLSSALEFAERQKLRLPFVTADHRQAQAAEALGLRLTWLG